MSVSIPPKMSVSSFMGYLKGKPASRATRYTGRRHARIKIRYHTYIFIVENLSKIAYTTKRVQKGKGKLFRVCCRRRWCFGWRYTDEKKQFAKGGTYNGLYYDYPISACSAKNRFGRASNSKPALFCGCHGSFAVLLSSDTKKGMGVQGPVS